jgi:hypothetical protein
MGAYDFNFDVPAGERYSPSAERVKAWQALLPDKPFGFAPPITDRAAWDVWRDRDFGQMVLRRAREHVAAGYPDYDDEVYIDALDREDVSRVNPALSELRLRLSLFLMAEAIHDEGEFIPALEDHLERLSQLGSWVHPNNDLERRNLRQETFEVDLVTAHWGNTLSKVHYVLGPRLSDAFKAKIAAEVDKRVFSPLRMRFETGHDLYWWIDVTHNWNSVNFSCVAEAAVALLPAEERAWWIALCEMHVGKFRESFTNDGFCTEGVGYWGYGVSHYIHISELLRLGSGGLVDLLDEPKMSRVMLYPERVEIQPGLYPCYADCRLGSRFAPWAQHWLDNRRGADPDASKPIPDAAPFYEGMHQQMPTQEFLWMFHTLDPMEIRRSSRPLGLRHWFKDATLLICRPAEQTRRRFSATLIGGNNGVNHNHNDLGTFTAEVDGRPVLVDPGLETNSFRNFSVDRYDSDLLNSYGHPVPRVAGELQQPGPEWITRTVETDFTDDVDRVVLDLRRAYDAPTLRRLEREFIYDRRGEGSLTIIDRAEFSEPSDYESALITYGEPTLGEDGRLKVTYEGASVAGEVTLEGGELEFATDTLNEPAGDTAQPYQAIHNGKVIPMSQPGHATRIALRAREPVTAVTLTTVIRPA